MTMNDFILVVTCISTDMMNTRDALLVINNTFAGVKHFLCYRVFISKDGP